MKAIFVFSPPATFSLCNVELNTVEKMIKSHIIEAVPKCQILEQQPCKMQFGEPVGRETARACDKITDFGTGSINTVKKIGVILSLFFYVSVCEIKAQDLITLPDKPVFTDIIEYSYDYDDFYGKTNKIEYDTAWLGADNKYAEISAHAWWVAVKENYFIINHETIYYKNGQTQSIENILKDYISKTGNAEIKDVFNKLGIHVEKLFENQIVRDWS